MSISAHSSAMRTGCSNGAMTTAVPMRAPGLAGKRPGQRRQRRADPVMREVMLGQPHRVEAELVGEPALLDAVGVHLGMRLPVTEGEEVLGREFHRAGSSVR